MSKKKGSRGILGFTEEQWIDDKGHLNDSDDTATNPIRVYLTDKQYFHFGLACIRTQQNLSDLMRKFIYKEVMGIDLDKETKIKIHKKQGKLDL